MKRFLVTFTATLAALFLFFFAAPLLVGSLLLAALAPGPTRGQTILTLDLRDAIADQETASPFALLTGRSLSVTGVVRALDHAAKDPGVRGLLVRVPEGGVAPGGADEIRTALQTFRASGKPVLAHSQGIYASGVSTAAYLLGAASGDFWMQPGAPLQSVGLAVEETFFKRAFDRLGLKADFLQRAEYKNAVNPLLYDDYTPAHKEAQLGWLRAVYDTELTEAAKDRHTDAGTLRAALEKGPYAADEALRLGLVDHVGQEQEAEEALRARAGEGAKFLAIGAYRPASDGGASQGGALALISGEGEITTGTAKGLGLGRTAIYSDEIAGAFQRAAADNRVKAIVFRISSPGGSDTASEQVLAAVRAAEAAGKPVVVSMGEYAASGGYWVSCQASEIVAEPTTLTGSIGVFGGKFVLGPALAKFGVDTRGLSVGGSFASANDAGAAFTPDQRAAVSRWLDRIYDTFIARVAAGRRLAPARVREIAKGRIWSGAQALHLGLVDRLGGLDVAIAEAQRLGGLPAGATPRLLRFPADEGAFGALSHGVRSLAALGVLVDGAQRVVSADATATAALRALSREEAGPDGGVVLVPFGLPR